MVVSLLKASMYSTSFIVSLIFLGTASAHVQTDVTCEALFKISSRSEPQIRKSFEELVGSFGESRKSENDRLALFRIDEIDFTKTISLGNPSVYRIETHLGQKFVVRIRSRGHETHGEAFSSRFAIQFAGQNVGIVKVLQGVRMDELVSKLRENKQFLLPYSFSPKFSEDSNSATIVPFYESVRPGTQVLKDYGILEFDPTRNLSSVEEQLLVESITSKLPSSLISQLADMWATYTILGLPDFHPANWFLDADRVLGIDLANHHLSIKRELFDRSALTEFGLSGLDGRMMHPFGGTLLGPGKLRDFLLSNVSQSFKDRLKLITLTDLQTLAQETGYNLIRKGYSPPHEIDDLSARIKYFSSLP